MMMVEVIIGWNVGVWYLFLLIALLLIAGYVTFFRRNPWVKKNWLKK
jgi:hypothetical protein